MGSINRTTILLLVFEAVVFIGVIIVLLSTRQSVSTQTSTATGDSDFLEANKVNPPISPNDTSVESAIVSYSFDRQVKEIAPRQDGYSVVVNSSDPQIPAFTIPTGRIIVRKSPDIGAVNIENIRPGDTIQMFGTYDIKNQKWYKFNAGTASLADNSCVVF